MSKSTFSLLWKKRVPFLFFYLSIISPEGGGFSSLMLCLENVFKGVLPSRIQTSMVFLANRYNSIPSPTPKLLTSFRGLSFCLEPINCMGSCHACHLHHRYYGFCLHHSSLLHHFNREVKVLLLFIVLYFRGYAIGYPHRDPIWEREKRGLKQEICLLAEIHKSGLGMVGESW